MSKFSKITAAILVTNKELAEYLRQASIKPARKRGAFVGNYDVAPDEFCKYGIILPKGGMIIPDVSSERLKDIVNSAYEKKEDTHKKEREQKILHLKEQDAPCKARYANHVNSLLKRARQLPLWYDGKIYAQSYEGAKLFPKEETLDLGGAQFIVVHDEYDYVQSLHKKFRLGNEDEMQRFFVAMNKWIEDGEKRSKELIRAFRESGGIIRKVVGEHFSVYTGNHSFVNGKAKYDEGYEIDYYVGKSNTPLYDIERKWFIAHVDEVAVPNGYYRVPIMPRWGSTPEGFELKKIPPEPTGQYN